MKGVSEGSEGMKKMSERTSEGSERMKEMIKYTREELKG